MDHFHRNGMTTYHPPIVGVGPHSGDPHYEPTPGQDGAIGAGRLRPDRPLGQDGPAAGRLQRPDPRRLRRRRRSRRSIERGLQDRRRRPRRGDRPGEGRLRRGPAAPGLRGRSRGPRGDRGGRLRRRISSTGPATTSARRPTATAPTWTTSRRTTSGCVLPRTCFSIEPGIYLPEFGVRSEVNVFIGPDGDVHVTGEPQQDVLAVLA